MRQGDFKSGSINGLCFFCTLAALLAGGCRDNPQDRAAKEVHRQIQAALQKSDAAAARQEIQSAVSRHRPTGFAQDSANLVSGNLTLAEGVLLLAELPLKTLAVQAAVEAIAADLIRSQEALLEKGRIAKMLALQDAEILELQTLIRGTAGMPGLEARLRDARAEWAELTRQRRDAQQERDAIQTVIDDYQSRSESLLKEADLADGDEKLRLQQQAYKLQLERKDDYVEAQSVENRIRILDDQISLAQSQVQALEGNLAETKVGIESVETAESRKLLNAQQQELDRMLSQHQTRIYANADAIKTGLAAYRQAVGETIDVLLRAGEQFQGVRSADAKLSATLRQADSYQYAAQAATEQVIFLRGLSARLTGLIEASDASLVRGLAERLPLSADPDMEQLQKIANLFEQADRAYEEAMNLARRIPERGREAAASVLSSRLLALHSMMQLADTLGQYDLASQTQAKLDALKQQGKDDFGSLFALSETARLLEDGLNYVPSLPVNVELYFESIRQRFTEWKQLETPEEKAEAVEQNFARMNELIETYGDEMSRLLEPLRQEMLAAKERNFITPVAAPTPSPTAPGLPGDPNAFF